MRKNEKHISVADDQHVRLKKLADDNGRTMRGQLEVMLKDAEKKDKHVRMS